MTDSQPVDVTAVDPGQANNRHLYPAYYDREGNQISLFRQCELARDPKYKILAHTEVPGGSVISAWLGDDQRVIDNGEPPLIYGTIFCSDPVVSDTSVFDHSVEEFSDSPEQALAYHEQLVELVRALADPATLSPEAPDVPAAGHETGYKRRTVSPELPVNPST